MLTERERSWLLAMPVWTDVSGQEVLRKCDELLTALKEEQAWDLGGDGPDRLRAAHKLLQELTFLATLSDNPEFRRELRLEQLVGRAKEWVAADDWILCGVCGTIALDSEWTYWQPNPDEAAEEETPLVPHEFGQTDPMARCPRCGWEHRDTDDGSGYYQGTRQEMERTRTEEHANYGDAWDSFLAGGDA